MNLKSFMFMSRLMVDIDNRMLIRKFAALDTMWINKWIQNIFSKISNITQILFQHKQTNKLNYFHIHSLYFHIFHTFFLQKNKHSQPYHKLHNFHKINHFLFFPKLLETLCINLVNFILFLFIHKLYINKLMFYLFFT